MKNSYVLDTSFISSLIVTYDANHSNARELYATLSPESDFYLPATVYMETMLLVEKLESGNKGELFSLLNSLSAQTVFIDSMFLSEFRKYLRKWQTNLKAIDLSVLVTANMKEAQILSFDKQLIEFSRKL